MHECLLAHVGQSPDLCVGVSVCVCLCVQNLVCECLGKVFNGEVLPSGVCVCEALLDCDVLLGLPMYFRMGFLLLSSPSFSFLPLLSWCEEENGMCDHLVNEIILLSFMMFL